MRSMKRHVGHLVALLALTVGLTASADVAPTTFVAESGPIDAFMTGVPLAVDGGDADANVDALALPASIDVAASEIPDGATLVRAFLFWGGTQSEDGSADPSVTLSSPGGGPTVIDADVCHASDAASASYDMFACRAEITASILAAGGPIAGTYQVDEYSGLIANGATDNASAALLLIFTASGLPSARVVASDGLLTMSSNAIVLSQPGFDASTSIGSLTYYTMEGDLAGTGTEQVSVRGLPSGAGPIVFSDAINPATNPMNQTVNTASPPRTAAIGVDIDRYPIDQALAPGDSTIEVTYSTGTDKWWLAAQVASVRSHAPVAVPALPAPLGPWLLGAALAWVGGRVLVR